MPLRGWELQIEAGVCVIIYVRIDARMRKRILRTWWGGWSILSGASTAFAQRRQIVLLLTVRAVGLVDSVW